MKSRRKHTMSIISVILSALLVFTQFPVSAWAAEPAGRAVLGGSGTAEDPYTIGDVAALQLMAQNINNNVTGYNGSNVYYRLDADLDLTGINWVPIGNGISFQSVFDGNGKRIQNLSIQSTSSCQGLFGIVAAGGRLRTDFGGERYFRRYECGTAGRIFNRGGL